MKKVIYILAVVLLFACSSKSSKNQPSGESNPFPEKYENVLFSVNYPKGWICDDSGWQGLDSITNVVDIYNQYGDIVRFHFVKTFLNIQWKDINEATEFAKTANVLSGEESILIDEVDSVEVGGYPTSILYFAHIENEDTLIQKQFVTYMKDCHILLYFNEVFYYQDWDSAQELGDAVIETIKLKKVKNPLDNNENAKRIIQDAMDKGKIDDNETKQVEQILKKNNILK